MVQHADETVDLMLASMFVLAGVFRLELGLVGLSARALARSVFRLCRATGFVKARFCLAPAGAQVPPKVCALPGAQLSTSPFGNINLIS